MTGVTGGSWEHASKIYFYWKTYFCKLVEDRFGASEALALPYSM